MTWYADLFHMYFKNLRSHKLSIEIPNQDTRKLSFDGSISEKCKPFFQIGFRYLFSGEVFQHIPF